MTRGSIILCPAGCDYSATSRAAIISVLESGFSGSIILLLEKNASRDWANLAADRRLRTFNYELPTGTAHLHRSIKRLFAIGCFLGEQKRIDDESLLVLDPEECLVQADPARFLENSPKLTFFATRNGQFLGMDVNLRWLCFRLFGEEYFWTAAREPRLTDSVLLGPTSLVTRYFVTASELIQALGKTPELAQFLCHDLGVLLHHRLKSSFASDSVHVVENGSPAVLDLEFFEPQDLGFAEQGKVITREKIVPAIISGLSEHLYLSKIFLGNWATGNLPDQQI